jgi:tetrapyrrole methylase family protein/MazG family protein
MEHMLKEKYDFSDLLDIMKLLRSEKGCPWIEIRTMRA